MIIGSPAAPTSVTAVSEQPRTLSVGFVAPAANGAAIFAYTASCASANGGAARSAGGTDTPVAVSGLTAGATYTCTVAATNSRGIGLPSAPSAPATA